MAPIPEDCPLMPQPGEGTHPSLPLRDEIRAIATKAAIEAALLAVRGEDSGDAHPLRPSRSSKSHRMDWQAAAVVVLAVIGGVVWLVRLEGRVNASDARAGTIEGSIVRIEDEIPKAQDPILKRLDRMENKMDQLLGEGRRR